MVRSKPLPFPPEPFAFTGVQLTRWSLAAADRNGGRRNRGCGRSTGSASVSTRDLSRHRDHARRDLAGRRPHGRGGPPALARLERRLVHGRPLARGRAPLRRGRRRGRRSDRVDRGRAQPADVVTGGPAARPSGRRGGAARVGRADGVRRVLGRPPRRRARRVRDRDRLAGLPVPAASTATTSGSRWPGCRCVRPRPRTCRGWSPRASRTTTGSSSTATPSPSPCSTRPRPASPCTSRTRWPTTSSTSACTSTRRCAAAGVGSSILALTARDVLAQGRTPVAGCWWKNWASRVTLETAGLTCAGTIFRLDLDPDVFAREDR